MAAQCWMAVVMTVVLTKPILAVDQNRLGLIVNGILTRYGTQGMFSLAVTIPENQNLNVDEVLLQVFLSDPPANVINALNNNEVYVGNRVVAAKGYRRPGQQNEHAESRVVDRLRRILTRSNQNDLLLFYVYASPCVEKCSNNKHRQNILRRIRLIRRWSDWAVVFSTIFRPNTGPENTEEQRREALLRLGASVELSKIFRCDGNPTQCTSCYSYGYVSPYCFSG